MNSLGVNAFVTKRTEKLTVEALTGPEGVGEAVGGKGIGKEDSFFSCSARGQPSILRTQKAGSWAYGSVVCPGVAPHLVSCCHHLEILDHLGMRGHPFLFCPGPCKF